MSKICINIDELVSGTSKMHLVTLRHAAEISPFITERTLGADLPEHKSPKRREEKDECRIENKKVELDNKENKKQTADNKNQTNIKSDKNESRISQSALNNAPNNGSFQNLDFQAINNSVKLREAEQQRRQSMHKELVEQQQQRQQASQQGNEQRRAALQRDNEKWLADKRRCEAQIIDVAEQQAAKQQQQHANELEALHKQTQRQLQMISFQGISQYYSKFRGKYENVAKLLLSIDKQALLACEEYNETLKELTQQFEQLIAKIKAGECGAAELKMSENLCKSLDALEDSIIKALENIIKQEEQRTQALNKEEEDRRQQQEQQQQQQQQAQQQQQQQQKQQLQQAEAAAAAAEEAAAVQLSLQPHLADAATQPPTVATAATPATTEAPPAAEAAAQYVSTERFNFYTQINTYYQEKVEKVKPLQSDESLKKYRFACQKAINIPVNAISAVNAQHLADKFEKLYNFISGQPLKTAEGQLCVNDHPLGRDYCILLMAKKFVNQGDTAVSSNPQAAFPVASVIVSLWRLVPDFGQIFLAYTFKESPFLVPYFIPQKRAQPIEEYYKVLGYRVTNGQLEQQDMYLKRQAGIARLYAAVMITAGRQQDGPQHPYAIEQGWRWLANFVYLAPLPDICATIMLEMLQTIGADMWAAYGKQFVKLLLYVQQQYFPKLSAVDEGGPKARLELLLGKFLREGQIPRPQGMLPPGFW